MIAIVGHTSRHQQVLDLAGATGAEYVTIDDGTLRCEGNHIKAWTHLAEHATTEWAVVLEDDAIPCDDFRQQLDQALAVAPTPIVGLYLGTGHPTHWQRFIGQAIARAEQSDATWIMSEHLLHAVGYAIRTELIPDMLKHAATGRPIDQAVTDWARKRGHQVAYTHPSLVDHEDGEPAIRRRHDGRARQNPRKAWRHGTREHWTNSTVRLG